MRGVDRDIISFIARQFFNWLLYVLGGRLRVYGLHNLPQQGPYVLVSNHMSISDAPIMLIALPPIAMHFWIADKWRTLPVFGYLANRLGGIFINRESFDRRAIREALQHLQAGRIVGLAPEATRSPIGQMIKPRNGAAYLAHHAGVPIVPVGIIGTDALFGNFLRLRTTSIEIIIGKPFSLPEVPERVRGAELEAYTDYIMMHVAQLIPREQHGYYQMTQHPALAAALRGEDPWPYCYPLRQ